MGEVAAPTEESHGYAADLLYAELRRTWPEELTKQELLKSSGLSTEEARAGLALLEAREKIDTSGGQLKAVVAGEDGPPEPVAPEEHDETGAGEAESPSDVPPPASTAPVPGAGETYHGHYVVMVAFGQNPGTKSDAAVKTAKAMETEMANRIHELYPGAVVSVELKAIEVFDKPRRIYDKGSDDGSTEPET